MKTYSQFEHTKKNHSDPLNALLNCYNKEDREPRRRQTCSTRAGPGGRVFNIDCQHGVIYKALFTVTSRALTKVFDRQYRTICSLEKLSFEAEVTSTPISDAMQVV